LNRRKKRPYKKLNKNHIIKDLEKKLFKLSKEGKCLKKLFPNKKPKEKH